jgi:hypothetical protein
VFNIRRLWLSLLLAVVLASGCGKSNTSTGDGSSKQGGAQGAASSKYVLTAEPSGAKGVIETRKDAKDGDEVVVEGRIGGDKKPWVEGRAVFWIVDPSIPSCRETKDDNCPTPWDYCCKSKDELAPLMATVKVVDEKGQTVQEDARKLLHVTELERVIVRGHAKRDEAGNLIILATGVYRPESKN